jgi:hypothetical protein
MLNNEEDPRGVPPQPGRRPAPPRFQDNRFSSPSSTYNYNSNAGYNQNNGFGGQQHPRRRIDRFKRETINYSDRIIRQNDSIIRLLKEIRDRLPAPPASAVAANEPDQIVQNGSFAAAAPENNEPVTEGIGPGFDQGQGPESDQAFEGQVEPQAE